MDSRRIRHRTASNNGSTGQNVETWPANCTHRSATVRNGGQKHGAASRIKRMVVAVCSTNVRAALQTAECIVTPTPSDSSNRRRRQCRRTFVMKTLNAARTNCLNSEGANKDTIATTGFRPNENCTLPKERHCVRTRTSSQRHRPRDGDARNVKLSLHRFCKEGPSRESSASCRAARPITIEQNV